jgi:Flp pilus assembly protein TadG
MKQLPTQHHVNDLQRGQSLVEMSIGFVLLLIVLCGLLDIGRAYYVYVALEDGAGEAALYLSIDPDCRTEADGLRCANPNNAEYRARNAGGENVNWSMAEITIERPPIYGVGDPVKVTIRYSLQLLTPFIPQFAGINPIPMTVQASQTIIRETH